MRVVSCTYIFYIVRVQSNAPGRRADGKSPALPQLGLFRVNLDLVALSFCVCRCKGMYELLPLSRVRALEQGHLKKGPFIFHCFHVELLAYLYDVHTYIQIL